MHANVPVYSFEEEGEASGAGGEDLSARHPPTATLVVFVAQAGLANMWAVELSNSNAIAGWSPITHAS